MTEHSSCTAINPQRSERNPLIMAVPNDIHITYVNATKRTDFVVCVFQKNESPSSFETPFVAWHTLKTPGTARFVYPVDVAVGADWTTESGEVDDSTGPLPTQIGCSWKMIMNKESDTPQLIPGIYVHLIMCIHAMHSSLRSVVFNYLHIPPNTPTSI